MSTPFKKIISDFSGGQIDFFASRDMADNTYQEVTNAELRLSGVVKRPESNRQVSAFSGDSFYDMESSQGKGFSLLHSEFGLGEDISPSVTVTNVFSYPASESTQRNDDCSLARGVLMAVSSGLSFKVGDHLEIWRDGASVAEEDIVIGIWGVTYKYTDVLLILDMPFFEIAGGPPTSAHTMTSNRYKIRNVHEYSPNVYGVVPCKIGTFTPTTRYYSESRINPTFGENAIALVGLANTTGVSAISVLSPSDGYGFYFRSASSWEASYPLSPELWWDSLFFIGGDFDEAGISSGQTITYTNSTALNPDTINNNYSGVVSTVLGTTMLRMNTKDDVVTTSGRFGGVVTISSSTFLDAKLEGWTDTAAPDINAYNLAGAIRIADANFDNENHRNKWYGYIRRSKFGESIQYGRPPASQASKPFQTIMAHGWEMEDQWVSPPTLIKMDGWGDPTYKVKEPGDIGLFVYDPKEFSNDSPPRGEKKHFTMRQEHVLYPDATIRETFSEHDKWATTFVYDGSSESELSRNESGDIGVSGFTTVTPPDILEEPVTFFDADDDETIARVVDYDDENFDPTSRSATRIRISCLTDGSEGAHQVLNIGDYIKVGSETMCIFDMQNHKASNGYTVYTVHRGVRGTTPVHLVPTDDEGLSVYKVEQSQSARAIAVVLQTGNNTPATIEFQQGGATKFYVEATKSLGALANMRLQLDIEYSATGSGDSTIFVNYTDVASSEQNFIRMTVTCVKKDSNAIAFEDVVNAINNDPVASSNVVITQTKTINDYCTAFVTGGIAPTAEITAAQVDKYFGDSTVGDSVNGINVEGLNKRITGFNLYWKPKGEVDYYLVNYFDVEKGWSNR